MDQHNVDYISNSPLMIRHILLFIHLFISITIEVDEHQTNINSEHYDSNCTVIQYLMAYFHQH